MRYLSIAPWILLIVSLTAGLPSSSVAADDQEGQETLRSPVTEGQPGQKTPALRVESPDKERATVSDRLVYNRPPGSPALVGILVANVPRGADKCLQDSKAGASNESPSLIVLAPADHAGLTTHEQPSLYWYLSGPVTCQIDVTVIDDQSIQPLLEITFPPPLSSGMHSVRLAEQKLSLLPGVSYQWSVALVPDPEDRSKDLVASGVVKRVEPPETLRASLAHADAADLPSLYAAAGLWYDAVMAIADLIDAAPGDPVPHRLRASLLEQVGLTQIIEREAAHAAMPRQ